MISLINHHHWFFSAQTWLRVHVLAQDGRLQPVLVGLLHLGDRFWQSFCVGESNRNSMTCNMMSYDVVMVLLVFIDCHES